MTDQRRRRTGPDPLPAAERRGHCVSVRLNAAELQQLDAVRGPFQRGEWLRMAALDRLPPTVPEINREAWTDLARAAGNLNQITRHLNEGGTADTEAIRAELAAFRAMLIGVQL
jgi:hypothetical protein